LLFLRDAGPTEIGAFGIALADDPLYVQDVQTVLQATTGASIEFNDESVADYFYCNCCPVVIGRVLSIS
jgi:hypothetical protein